MSAELIAQIAAIVLVIYVGWHLRSQLRTLKSTVDSQKATIEAQVRHREEFEALNRTMKQMLATMKVVLDTVGDPAALQREQAFKERVDRDAAASLEQRRSGPPQAQQAKIDWDVLNYDRPR